MQLKRTFLHSWYLIWQEGKILGYENVSDSMGMGRIFNKETSFWETCYNLPFLANQDLWMSHHDSCCWTSTHLVKAFAGDASVGSRRHPWFEQMRWGTPSQSDCRPPVAPSSHSLPPCAITELVTCWTCFHRLIEIIKKSTAFKPQLWKGSEEPKTQAYVMPFQETRVCQRDAEVRT